MKKTSKIVALLTTVLASALAALSFGVDSAHAWSKKADMPTKRYGLSASAANGKIYAFGGMTALFVTLETVEEYDPGADSWTGKTEMPIPRSGHATCEVHGKIYVIGGADLVNILSDVEEYDPANDTWAKKAELPTARGALAAAAVDGKIYVVGGTNGEGPLSAVEQYDPKTNTWIARASMPTPRSGLSACAVGGKIYALGGQDGIGGPGGGNLLAVVEEYDPVTNRWTTKKPMSSARSAFGVSVVDGKIYAFGGLTDGSPQSVEMYDPATDKWTEKPDMPTGRWGFSACCVGSRIYAIGGSFAGIFPHSICTVEEYNTIAGSQSIEAANKLATAWGNIKKQRKMSSFGY